ncbi:MAG: MoaD/ThiS family protein [Planctomycetaceae bacterium]
MHDDPRGLSAAPVRVALFAGLAEAAGGRFLDLPWAGGTVGDLRAAVAAHAPAAAALLARSAVVVAGRHATDSDAVAGGADVAILPPVSGG